MPRPKAVDSQCPGLLGDGWPDEDSDMKHDLNAQVGRHSGRKPADAFSIVDECIDLEIDLGKWKPRREQK